MAKGCSVVCRLMASALPFGLAAALIGGVTSAACGPGSSTASNVAPAAPSAPTTPNITSIAVSGTVPGVGATSQLTAIATLSNGTTQVVTTLATWQSSNAGVLTISPSGLATAVGPGDAEATATYGGVNGALRLTVRPRTYGLVGTITDEGTGRVIAGARVEVLTGVNAGTAVLSDSSGGYVFDALLADTFRIRASADDHQWGEQGVTVPANPRADFALRTVPAPCAVTASPNYFVVSSGGFVNPGLLNLTTASNCTWTVSSDRLYLRLGSAATLTHSVSGSGPAVIGLGYGVSLCAWQSTINITWVGGHTDLTVEQLIPKC